METSLLQKTRSGGAYQFSCSREVVPYAMAFFALSCLVLLHMEGQSMQENSVGVNPSRHVFFSTYFTLADLPDNMGQGYNYKGRDTKIRHPFEQHCTPQTPTCTEICKARSLSQDESRVGESELCRNQLCINLGEECWETTDMRCWDIDHEVWESVNEKEWTVVSQDLSGEAGIKWIHFFNDVHFYIFGYGNLVTIGEVCRKAKGATRLLREVEQIGSDEVIVFAGHREGALWAACINLVTAQGGRSPNFRHVIGSSVPPVTRTFESLYARDSLSFDTSVFLSVGLAQSGMMVMDAHSMSLSQDPNSITLPQFGFVCGNQDGNLICVDPQPLLRMDMAESVRYMQMHPQSPLNALLPDLRTYRACFSKCRQVFAQYQVDFSPNIGSYSPIQMQASVLGAFSRPPGSAAGSSSDPAMPSHLQPSTGINMYVPQPLSVWTNQWQPQPQQQPSPSNPQLAAQGLIQLSHPGSEDTNPSRVKLTSEKFKDMKVENKQMRFCLSKYEL